MRKSTIVTMLLVALSVLFVSCADTDKKQYAVIPNDCAALFKVNVGNIINESEILEVSMVRTALDFMVNSMPKDSRDMFREIISEPSKSGIEVNEPMVVSVELDPVEAVFALAISDKDRLVELIESVSEGAGVELVEEDGMTRMDFGLSGRHKVFDVVFNSDVMVVAVTEKGGADAEYYMNLDSGRKAVNDSRYDAFFANNSDASLFIDTKPIFDFSLQQKYMSDYERMMLEQYSAMDISALLALDFENGYMQLGCKMYASDKYIKDIENVWIKPDGRFLEYIPYDAIGVCNMAADFSKMFAMYPEADEKLLPVMQQYGFDKSMIESLTGDMMFAVLPVEEFGNELLPQMMFAVECSDRALFDAVINLTAKELTRVDDDVYALGLNKSYNYYSAEYEYGGYDYYLMYKENAILVLPENVYNKVADGAGLKELARNITDNNLFDSFDNAGMVCDANALIDMFKEIIGRLSQNDKRIFDAFKVVESLEFEVVEPTETIFRINMEDKDTNILKQVVDEVISFVSSAAMGSF